MELFGNKEKRRYVEHFFQHNQENHKPLFILLIWPEGVWKTSFLLDYIKKILWSFFHSDFLWMKDMSSVLGKNHALQVETPTSLKTIPLENWELYQNRGVRELTTRLQQSSLSGKKIVLIEKLERMTLAAMNAFLKTCEEPLANRFIFATVSSESEILPTILSRALLVRFELLSRAEMTAFLSLNYPDLWVGSLDLLLKLSLWSPGKATFLYQQLKSNSELERLLFDAFAVFQKGSNSSPYDQLLFLKRIADFQLLELFIDALLSYYTEVEDEVALDAWLAYKRFSSAAISQENLLWNVVLSS